MHPFYCSHHNRDYATKEEFEAHMARKGDGSCVLVVSGERRAQLALAASAGSVSNDRGARKRKATTRAVQSDMAGVVQRVLDGGASSGCASDANDDCAPHTAAAATPPPQPVVHADELHVVDVDDDEESAVDAGAVEGGDDDFEDDRRRSARARAPAVVESVAGKDACL